MSLRDLLAFAWSNLGRRKLRTGLTIFAIVIGATLLALMVSLGAGVQVFLQSQLQSFLPTQVIWVSAMPLGNLLGGGGSFGGAPRALEESLDAATAQPRTLGPENIAALRKLPHVERVDVIPALFGSTVRLKGETKTFSANVDAQLSYQLALAPLQAGEAFQETERGKAIISGQFVESFGFASPGEALGKEIEVGVTSGPRFLAGGRQPRFFTFQIVGVLEKNLNSSGIGITYADALEMGRYFAQDPALYTEAKPGPFVALLVNDARVVPQVVKQIEQMKLHAITAKDIMSLLGQFFLIMEAVLSIFGLIALGVASLGIVNTLVMAIYERTREIGVMKGVGASRAAIRSLFLAEGAALGMLGGIAGVALGWGLGQVLNLAAHRTFIRDFPTFNLSVVSPWLVLGVVALSTLVALVAALYPASRAASLNPVEALRYE